MTRLPRTTGKELLRALQRGGFYVSHTRSSHYYLRKPGVDRLVVVPVHGSHDLPAGTLRSILRQADLTVDDLVDLLRS